MSSNRWIRLLAAALIVTAGLSAAQRHAHSGGDRSHRHHGDAADIAASELAGERPTGWFAAPLHMHVFLLGFQFMLPAGQESNNEPAADGDHMVVVKLAGDNVSAASARAPADEAHLAADISASMVIATCAPAPALVQSVMNCTAPLCDSARHERSGVQRT